MNTNINSSIDDEKNDLREYIWNLLYKKGLSKRKNGDFNKIPDFKGSQYAAKLLQTSKEWTKADVIFCSPDSAQTPVRKLALEDEKNLIMASANLKHGYLFLEGEKIKDNADEASTKEGAFKYQSEVDSFGKIDLVIEGSVAVDRYGHRIGKGKGYGDREIEDLFNRNLIDSKTPIATTIHRLQLVDKVPVLKHDMKVNMIITTESIIRI